MALVISVLVLGLGVALVLGPERSVGGVETSEIGVIVLAVGVIGMLASLMMSRRAAAERALREDQGLRGRGWPEAAAVEIEEVPDDESQPFRPPAPKRPPTP
jgi:hypothetical protein